MVRWPRDPFCQFLILSVGEWNGGSVRGRPRVHAMPVYFVVEPRASVCCGQRGAVGALPDVSLPVAGPLCPFGYQGGEAATLPSIS